MGSSFKWMVLVRAEVAGSLEVIEPWKYCLQES